ncbi:hypothetical protein [Mangrovicoccus sp. HB161399]|uniref:hypothetical protein n=1 Tax=Mangrovicoccus sp. HB161399 TaxID=2720392 RepID=UPI001552F73D|nr:hypothetical protein [Mangrovicoccus sp. HB161399]
MKHQDLYKGFNSGGAYEILPGGHLVCRVEVLLTTKERSVEFPATFAEVPSVTFNIDAEPQEAVVLGRISRYGITGCRLESDDSRSQAVIGIVASGRAGFGL